MRNFCVSSGTFKLGPHQKMQLSADQIDARGYCLEVIDDKAGICISTAEVQFKSGEKIGLPDGFPAPPYLDALGTETADSAVAKRTGNGRGKGKGKGKGKPAASDVNEPDLDQLEKDVDAAEAILRGIDPSDAATIQEAQQRVDAAKEALEAALGL